MNGLILYKQYLENVMASVKNYELPKSKNKTYLDALSLSKEIEDLAYLDMAFSNAGVEISYLGEKDFLRKPVNVVSKMEKMIDISTFDDSIRDIVIENFRNNVDEEEDSISELNKLLEDLNSLSDEEVEDEGFIGVETSGILNLQDDEREEIIALFSAFNSISNAVKEVQEEVKEEEEQEELEREESEQGIPHKKKNLSSYDENKEIDLFGEEEDIEEDNSLLIPDEEEPEGEDEDSEEEIEVEDSDKSENLDGFDMEDKDADYFDDITDEELKNKDFSKFIGEDSDEEEPNFISKFERSFDTESPKIVEDFDRNSDRDFDEIDGFDDDLEEEKGRELDAELNPFMEDDEEEDYERNTFEDIPNLFMKKAVSEKQRESEIEEMRAAYKSKERLSNSSDIDKIDDSLAKLLLAMGVGFMSLPKFASKFVQRFKDGSKKLKETMIVTEDDEDE